MDFNFPTKQISELEEKLQIRKALQDITNRIHAAQNIKEILVDLKEGILQLFAAENMTIYVVDRNSNEIYSMFLAGTQLKEIRVPINNRSVAGYVAQNQKLVNVMDVYNLEEIKGIDKQLLFDSSWDKKSGFRTKQVLASPILRNNVLMGVIQILNKKKAGRFSDEETGFVQEIAEVLAVAFYNQERLAKRRKTRFDYLISRDLLKEEELDSAWEESRENKETMEDFLMNKYKISKSDIGHSLEEFYRCKYIAYNEKTPIPGDLLKNLKKEYLRRELWVPIGKVDGKIQVIVDDPNNILKRDMIESLLKTKAVKYDVSLAEDIIKYINLFYHSTADDSSINDILGKLEGTEEYLDDEEDADAVTESDSVIMQLVNKIINDAYTRRSSDIHIEPNITRKNVEVRFRVDGDCALYQTLPFSYRAALVSRIKIMSNLDITVKRIPQDGKIKFKRPTGDEIELRVATIPTQGGVEDVVMRILAKGEIFTLSGVSLSKRNCSELLKILEKPYGMILVVGPTGSGKTTMLHAALHHINTPERKIWTAEDPVEISQYGLRQVQVQPKIGFDFAAAMRSFLRADPDVIMVGEMRDFETAKIGVEASLTGHLVFSTLHTNSAPETIVRLLDMGIDPLNFADSLLGIVAQRLVRTLCKNCKTPYHPSLDEYNEIVDIYGEQAFKELNIPYGSNLTLYKPKGCDACDKSGYKGRMAIHELLLNSNRIKRHIQKHETVELIRETGMEEGMTTLLQDGIEKALQGLTDIKQVRRVCIK
ncbi:MAG TPA: GspE/PulE family protein [Syntrophales bacterium]|jgi:type II secretory ATPase GspE/PulE/Tfp pilus assembly ATPase PilB-like protein/putative methionine-R-sulfoxide reductase with GAF domain|nr:GspE/PulE family protein [Syntrophales bacterium]HQA82551.1 GspE/PulE family protein [Syntrophales bacterium]